MLAMNANQLFSDITTAFILPQQRPVENDARKEMRHNRRDSTRLYHTRIQVKILAPTTRHLPQATHIGVNALHMICISFVKSQ